MQPAVWAAIDGDSKIANLSQVAERFPAVSQINQRNYSLIVAEYSVWLAKIIAFQEAHHE